MIKSINGWAFSSELPYEKVFKLTKDAGFEAIELVIADSGPISLGTSQAQVEDVAALAESHGLKLASLASGLGWHFPITSVDSDIAAKGIETTLESLQIANWLGVDAILLVPGGVSVEFIPGFSGAPYDIAYDNAYSALKQIAPTAEELGVTVGLENVWNQFLLSPLELRDLIDKIGSPRIGAYFDVGNILLTGQPDQWIRILNHRITRVHLKDFKLSVGTLSGFCDLLEGDVDYPSVITALNEIGYDGYVTAEFFNVEDQLPKISGAIDKILGRV